MKRVAVVGMEEHRGRSPGVGTEIVRADAEEA